MNTIDDTIAGYREWAEYVREHKCGRKTLSRVSGLSPNRARKIVQWVRDGVPERYRAAVGEAKPAPAPSAPTEVAVSAPSGKETRITYDANHEEGVYLFWIPGRSKPLRLSFDRVRAMKRDYSNHGGAATLNELARAHGLMRSDIIAIKRAMGWTHDSLPFTDEELAERDLEDLVAEGLALKERELNNRIERENWRHIRKDADRWRKVQRSIADVLAPALDRIAEAYEPPPPAVYEVDRERRFMLVVSPTDLHYGKAGWAGFGAGEYGRETCRTRLLDAIADTIEKLPCPPEEILVPIGSDWFHIDNQQGTTTRGTPQDMDGVPEQILEEGVALALEMLDSLRAVAPLRIVLQAGNHDWMLSQALFLTVRAHYRHDAGVTIEGDHGPYQYVTYGETLIGVTHGDGLSKVGDLGPLMAVHAAKQWGASSHRYWLTGNLHHHTVQEAYGVEVLLLPSLAGSDRWHTSKGYTTSRYGMMSLLVDYEDGITQTIRSYP